MKTNTIGKYILVYLLAPGHWNLIVPVRGGDDPDGSSVLGSGEAGKASPYTVLLNDLYPDFYTSSFSAGSDGSVASESDKEADNGSLLRGSNASGGDSQGAGVLTSTDSGLTSGAADGSNSGGSPADGSTSKTGFDLNLTLEAATNEFDYKEEGRYATYIAKDNYAFKLVKDDSTELWKAIDPSEYLSRVEADLLGESKVVTICLSENKTKVFKKDVENDRWTTIDTSKVNPMSVNIDYLDESYFYTNTIDDGVRTFEAKHGFAFKGANEYADKKVEIWKTDKVSDYSNKIEVGDNKVTIHLPYGSKVYIRGSDGKWAEDGSLESDGSPKTGVDLNIKSDTKSKDKFEYKKVGQYVTYTAKGDNAFKLVKDDKTELWRASDSDNYSGRVEVDLISNDAKAVTIHFPGNKTKVFKKDGKSDPWREIDITKVTPSSININYPHQSYFCKNELDNNFRTFEAKTGFLFNGFREGNTDIWTTTDEAEYANKVEYAKRYSGYLDVKIYMGSGKKKLFIKENANHTWKEIDLTKVTPESVNIGYDKETYYYSNKVDGSTRIFEARDGFAFNVVNEYINNNKVDIWKTTNDSEYAQKVEFAKRSYDKFDVTIHLVDGKNKLFVKESENDQWNEIDITKVNPESVDINYEQETHSYRNEYKGYYRKFTAKNGFNFSSAYDYVDGNKVEIWKADNKSEYVTRIEYMGGEKLIVYIGDDGTAKVIEKAADGKWPREDTALGPPAEVGMLADEKAGDDASVNVVGNLYPVS